MSAERTNAIPDVRPLTIPPVLVLADHIGYSGGMVHGATSYFLSVLPRLKQAGVPLVVSYLRDPHPAADRLRQEGVEPIFLSLHPLNPMAVLKVVRMVRQHGIGIIHAAGLKSTLVGRIVSLLTGAAVILHLHDLIYPGKFLRWLQGIFARRHDLAICVSKAAEPVARQGYHVPAGGTRVVYNGIPLESFRSATSVRGDAKRHELGILPERKVIAIVGRMYPVKGHQDMLHIMREVVRECPQALLLVVGDGPERAACEALTVRLHLQNHVRFIGLRADVPELLTACDLVVVPSRSEGLCISAIEAMAMGRPVVSFAVGGLPEVISDGRDGRLIMPGDRQGFAHAIIELLNDEARRKQYGEQAYLSARRFDIQQHIDSLISCYRDAANSRKVRTSLFQPLKDAYRKNIPELIAWRNGGLPKFVTAWRPREPLGGVPVFCYHLVDAEKFEADLRFLKRNGYQTLSATEFVQYLSGKLQVQDRAVLLAFDDGPRNFYDVVFPLLLKYQAKAVAFIAPGLHGDGREGDPAEARPMTWQEIEKIHASGLVEFQSHTYESRYIPDWPRPAALAGCDPAIESARRRPPKPLLQDLWTSQLELELRLPGLHVTQLAFPMYVGNEEAVAVAKELGFEACYWGLLPGHPLNKPGDSPYYISRVSDEFLRRLPGHGRISMLGLLRERWKRIRSGREWRRRYGRLPMNLIPTS